MKIRKILIDSIPAFLVGAVILYVAVTREQTFLKTLPTLITLVVQMLLVAANRYAFLLGGTNAVLYGVAYYSEGLYFSMISAVVSLLSREEGIRSAGTERFLLTSFLLASDMRSRLKMLS